MRRHFASHPALSQGLNTCNRSANACKLISQ